MRPTSIQTVCPAPSSVTIERPIPALDWPLMRNNIERQDLDVLTAFLQQDDPILTQSSQVAAFEEEWSQWLGIRYSVFVNSGSSANLLTLAALRERVGPGEIIVPTLTWVSDIASVIQNGFVPVFVDADPQTLGMNVHQVLDAVTPETRAVFLTHILGFNALEDTLLTRLAEMNIPLIEDVCESHGATYQENKLGTYGLMSNFSFYYAHHMSTIEGGMICTDDRDLYEHLRMLRSHGMVRECLCQVTKKRYAAQYPDLSPEFIFAFPGFNVRGTELHAVLGRSQLKRLDARNRVRQENFRTFLQHLDPDRYQTNFSTNGSCNYAFILILKRPDRSLRDKVMLTLKACGVEFRRGTSGGGNQLRQPYIRQRFPEMNPEQFPVVDHIHHYGFYLGNYPELTSEKILELCEILNSL